LRRCRSLVFSTRSDALGMVDNPPAYLHNEDLAPREATRYAAELLIQWNHVCLTKSDDDPRC
jgi:hypothetical protein